MNIAVVGSNGIVGQNTLKILKERGLLGHKIFLFDIENTKISLFNRIFSVSETNETTLLAQKLDYALFCTREEISKKYIPILAQHGTKCIDFSAEFRHDYPLILPEINSSDIKGNIICNPNCSTAASVVALNEISKQFGLSEIVYSSYQAVSGAGKGGLSDLFVTSPSNLTCFDYPIFNNIIPYIGSIAQNGYSTEENKMIYETKKILGNNEISISATCVRVPVDIGHSISINFTTKTNCSLSQIKATLQNTSGVVVLDSPKNYPMPIWVKGKNEVLVGRIRNGHKPNNFNIFVVGDNLRKGASLNAVQILEELIKIDSV